MAANCSICSDVEIQPSAYPKAKRDESVCDDFYGTEVADPYRWLEDPDASETVAYVDELNKVSQPFLESCSVKDGIKEKLTDMWDFPKYGCTSKRGDYYFYSHNTGLQNQNVIFIQGDGDCAADDKVFLDPNTLSKDGTTHLSSKDFSHDGSIMAYQLSEKGSDWASINFVKVPSAEPLPDVIPDVKFSNMSFTKDASGIFYSKYPSFKTETDGTSTEKLEYHSLYYHKMGTDSTDDIQVFTPPSDKPDYSNWAHVSQDGQFLFLFLSSGCDPYNMLYYYDLTSNDEKIEGKLDWIPILDTLVTFCGTVTNVGDNFILKTNLDAPMFKLVTANIKDPRKENWVTLLEENPTAKLDDAQHVAGDKLVVRYMEDVKNTIYVHDLHSGKRLYKVPTGIGAITELSSRAHLDEIFFAFESFLTPTTIYRYVVSEEKSEPELVHQAVINDFNQGDFETKQLFYASKDRTQIPMYVVHRKGINLNGENPTLLYGYGGFNLPQMPKCRVKRLLFISAFNGVFATANIRGGSEYGEKWHEAGMKEKKQNVFDDFIAAAEFLIDQKYTKPEKLCIHGGSNGGLLVAACSNQRPELFGAVINQVGVLDMLRYHKFTIGAAWTPEWGSVDDDKETFDYIYKYSPLHNLRTPVEVQFPSTLLMTADHDDRVVPSHSLKYIAQLYHLVAQGEKPIQRNQILMRVEVNAGHGAGKPTWKIIDDNVAIYSFLTRTLKLQFNQ